MHSKFYKMKFQRLTTKTCEKAELENCSNEADFGNEEQNLNNRNLMDTDILTIEGLRRTYNSCSNCGVCWYADHISLDCSECGGYAMRRPCPACNGGCGTSWRRDVKASHRTKRAQWLGTCALDTQTKWQTQNPHVDSTQKVDSNANFHDSYHSQSQALVQDPHIL